MANLTVNVGWDSLKEVFCQQVEGDANKGDNENGLFDLLKKAVVGTVLNGHKWDMKASDYLVCL